MYVRFVIQVYVQDSGRRLGLFQAISAMEEKRVLIPHEQDLYDVFYAWF
jgi:hypothetical protein